MTQEQTAEKLEDIARQMRDKTYTESSAMVLLTRSQDGGIMTLCKWGDDCESLIEEAFEVAV
jgi:hypothetical protein